MSEEDVCDQAPETGDACTELQGFFRWLDNEKLRTPAEGYGPYFSWLSDQLRGSTGDSCPNLVQLSADLTNESGWRSVSLATIRSKVQSYFEARCWDRGHSMQFVYIEGETNEQPKAGWLLYERGHQRCAALHVFFQYCFQEGVQAPDFLLGMAASIPGQVKKLQSKDEWQRSLIRGLGDGARAKYGSTDWSYMEVIQLLSATAFKSMKLKEFEELLKAEIPGFASKPAVDCKRLKIILDRVDKSVLQFAAKWADEHAGGVEVIPVAFWRNAKVLLPSMQRTSTSSAKETQLTPVGQLALVQRLLEKVRVLMAGVKQGKAGACLQQVSAAEMVKGFLATAMHDLDKMVALSAEFASQYEPLKKKHSLTAADESSMLHAFATGTVDSVPLSGSSAWRAVASAKNAAAHREERNKRAKELEEAERAAKQSVADKSSFLQGRQKLLKLRRTSQWQDVREELEKASSKAKAVLAQGAEQQNARVEAEKQERFVLLNDGSLPTHWQLKLSTRGAIWYQDLSSSSKGECKDAVSLLRLRQSCLNSVGILVLPGEPAACMGVEKDVFSLVGADAGTVLRRVSVKLSTTVEKLSDVRVVNMLVVHGDGEPSPDTVTARLVSSPAYKTCLLEFTPSSSEKKDRQVPRGPNGQLLWDRTFDQSFTHQIFRSLRLFPPAAGDVFVEMNPGPHLFQLLQEQYGKETEKAVAAPWAWLGMQTQKAPAKSKFFEDAIASSATKLCRRRLSSTPSNTDDVLDKEETELDLLAYLARATCLDDRSREYSQVVSENSKKQWLQLAGQKPEMTLPSGPLTLTASPSKKNQEDETIPSYSSNRLPAGLSVAKSCMDEEVALMQSCFSDGPGLVPAKDFVAGEAVITITGPFLTMQAALAYDCKAVLSLNFRRENSEKVIAKKCMPITSKSLLYYLHYLDGDAPDIDDGSDGDPSQVLALSPVVIQSPYREPVLRLEAREDMKAFQGELGVKFVVAPKRNHSAGQKQAGENAVEAEEKNAEATELAQTDTTPPRAKRPPGEDSPEEAPAKSRGVQREGDDSQEAAPAKAGQADGEGQNDPHGSAKPSKRRAVEDPGQNDPQSSTKPSKKRAVEDPGQNDPQGSAKPSKRRTVEDPGAATAAAPVDDDEKPLSQLVPEWQRLETCMLEDLGNVGFVAAAKKHGWRLEVKNKVKIPGGTWIHQICEVSEDAFELGKKGLQRPDAIEFKLALQDFVVVDSNVLRVKELLEMEADRRSVFWHDVQESEKGLQVRKQKTAASVSVPSPHWPRDGKPAAGVQLAWEMMYDEKPEAQCWIPVGLHLVTKKILTVTGSCVLYVSKDQLPQQQTADGRGRGSRRRGPGSRKAAKTDIGTEKAEPTGSGDEPEQAAKTDIGTEKAEPGGSGDEPEQAGSGDEQMPMCPLVAASKAAPTDIGTEKAEPAASEDEEEFEPELEEME